MTMDLESTKRNIREIKKNFEYILHHTKRLAERDGGILFFDKKKLDELFSYIEQQPEVFGLSIIFEYTKKARFSYIYSSELTNITPIGGSHFSKIDWALINDEFSIILKIEYNEILHQNMYMEPIRKSEMFEIGWFKNFNQLI